MKSIQLLIENEIGLHARPATLFVKIAQKHSSDITVEFGGSSADAKSIIGLLTLGVHQGSEITVAADGDDEDAALKALTKLVSTNFGDQP